MKTATFEGFHELPSLQQLDRQLTQQWDFGVDRKAAVQTARLMLAHLELGSVSIDLAEDYWHISHGAEVLWDASYLADARRLAALWRQTVTLICDRDGLDPTEPRIWSVILSARVEHRDRNFGAAVDFVQFAISETRSLAGGELELNELLSFGVTTSITEMHCAALALAIPAGRMRFGSIPALRAQILDRWVADAMVILGRDAPPKLKRAHALVIQTYYAIAERGWSEDREAWLDRLQRFDDLVRPSDPRGQATKSLRDVARSRFLGNEKEAIQKAQAARQSLRFLPRHLEALSLNRWWPLPPPAADQG